MSPSIHSAITPIYFPYMRLYDENGDYVRRLEKVRRG